MPPSMAWSRIALHDLGSGMSISATSITGQGSWQDLHSNQGGYGSVNTAPCTTVDLTCIACYLTRDGPSAAIVSPCDWDRSCVRSGVMMRRIVHPCCCHTSCPRTRNSCSIVIAGLPGRVFNCVHMIMLTSCAISTLAVYAPLLLLLNSRYFCKQWVEYPFSNCLRGTCPFFCRNAECKPIPERTSGCLHALCDRG